MEYNNGSENIERKNNNGRKNKYNDNGRNDNRNNEYRADRNNNDYNDRYVNEYDARRNTRKPDFAVCDKNGRRYIINGDFLIGLVADVSDWDKKMEYLTRAGELKDTTNYNEVAELLKALREIALAFINQNIYGTEYTMQDIKRGFPTHDDLYGLFEIITKKMNNK